MSSIAERIPLDDAAPGGALVARVRDALAADELVAMPTETVYGIAARADSEGALAALAGLKGRDPAQAWTWHVGDAEPLGHFEHLVPLARRLAERYWPGPLTLVLEGVPAGLEGVGRGGWTGLRLPAHRGTAGLLAGQDFPVVMTSANTSGEPPLVDADAVEARFGGDLALLLDGGPSRLGEASAVLRLGRGHFDVLREGLVSERELRATAGLRLGFCCTGNTCRSPMAEGLAKLELARRLGAEGPGDLERFGFSVESMGVYAGVGAPPSEHAVSVLAVEGYDLASHQSSPATLERVEALDHVFCLTTSHLEALRELLPPSKAGHVQLLDPAGDSIPDPIGGSMAVYRACMKRIAACIEARAEAWA